VKWSPEDVAHPNRKNNRKACRDSAWQCQEELWHLLRFRNQEQLPQISLFLPCSRKIPLEGYKVL